MKHTRYFFIIVFVFINIELVAQTTLQTVDFETAGGYTTSVAEFLIGVGQYYTRLNYTTSSSSVSVPAAYTNYQGNYIFLMEDTGGPTETQTMTLPSVDITNYTSLSLKVLVAGQNNTAGSLEPNKHMSFYANINGAGEVLIGSFRGNNASYLYKDDNLNSVIDAGETTVLTNAFTEYTFNISGTGTSMVITIKCLLSTLNEEGAYDNLRVIAGGILPVELTSFTALSMKDNVQLSWQTATEVNNYGFEVERSQNGYWQKIGFVPGSGNSNSTKSYSFTDKIESTEPYLYRLKQIDNDGTFEYSSTVEVDGVPPNDFALLQNYPNPFNPSTVIAFDLPEKSDVNLTVFSSLGEEIATLLQGTVDAGRHSVSFNAEGLPSGIYFYRITAGKFTSVKKLMLVR